jgi:hypothetical protein
LLSGVEPTLGFELDGLGENLIVVKYVPVAHADWRLLSKKISCLLLRLACRL